MVSIIIRIKFGFMFFRSISIKSTFYYLPLGVLVLLACIARNALAFDDWESELVASPARFEQSVHDTASMTFKVTDAEIKGLGLWSLPEVLMLTPGYFVDEIYDGRSTAQYHSSAWTSPKSMLLNIDAITVWNPIMPVLGIDELPISMRDVESIEINLGPAGASHGSDAFQSSVAIESRSPSLVGSNNVVVGFGSNDNQEVFLSSGGEYSSAKFALSGFSKQADGVDKGFSPDRLRSIVINTDKQHEDYGSSGFKLSAELALGSDSISATLIHSKADETSNNINPGKGDQFFDSRANTWLGNLSYQAQLSPNHDFAMSLSTLNRDLKQRFLSSQAIWQYTDAAADFNRRYFNELTESGIGAVFFNDSKLPVTIANELAAVISAASDISVLVENNYDRRESRTDLEVTNTYRANSSLTLFGGFGGTYLELDSDAVIGGDVSSSLYQLFGHIEYKPKDSFTFNLGGLFESIANTDNVKDNKSFSPRVSLNYRFTPRQTVKLAFAKSEVQPALAIRELDMLVVGQFEEPQNGTDEARFWLAPQNTLPVDTEKVKSVELMYLYLANDALFTAKLFRDSTYDLNAITQFNSRPVEGFNKHDAQIEGVEFAYKYQLLDNVRIGGSYTFMDVEASQYFEGIGNRDNRQSGSFYLLADLPHQTAVGIMYYAKSKDLGPERDRWSFNINKLIGKNLSLSYQFIHESNRENSILNDAVDIRPGNTYLFTDYDDRNLHFFSLGLSF